MSLLNKIATSQGNKLRTATANLIISAMGGKKIADWNRSLQDRIFEKERLRAILVPTEGRLPNNTNRRL